MRNPARGKKSARHPREHGLLRVKAVFGLRKNRIGVGFQYAFGDFLSAIRGEAMHHERAGFCMRERRAVDVVAAELREPERGFLLS